MVLGWTEERRVSDAWFYLLLLAGWCAVYGWSVLASVALVMIGTMLGRWAA